MTWRAAKAITTLLGQVNAAYPNRDKSSDGVIGDAAHSARTSDHNPNAAGVVCAVDITDMHGKPFEARVLAEAIKDDPRVHYVIHEGNIYNASVSRSWRTYTGSSPHTEHVHISLWQDAAKYDDARPFSLTTTPAYSGRTGCAAVDVREERWHEFVELCAAHGFDARWSGGSTAIADPKLRGDLLLGIARLGAGILKARKV